MYVLLTKRLYKTRTFRHNSSLPVTRRSSKKMASVATPYTANYRPVDINYTLTVFFIPPYSWRRHYKIFPVWTYVVAEHHLFTIACEAPIEFQGGGGGFQTCQYQTINNPALLFSKQSVTIRQTRPHLCYVSIINMSVCTHDHKATITKDFSKIR
jgi:hypothetical protein